MLRRWLIALVAVLALSVNVGCGAAPEPEEGASPQLLAFESTEPELDRYVDAMTVRLARATGRDDIRTETGGIPVSFRSGLVDPEDPKKLNCAQTHISRLGHVVKKIAIYIDPDRHPCASLPAMLVHEGMHAIAPDAEHSETGIFDRRGGRTSYIDADSLSTVCASFECSAFVPEL